MSLVVHCPACRQRIPLATGQLRPTVSCPLCGHAFPLGEAVKPADGTATLPPPEDPHPTAPLDPPPGDGAATGSFPPVFVPGYEVLGELGRGAMGVVYRARHRGLGRVVALKMILAGEHAEPEARRRFRLEAEAVARLEHPNVVPIHEVGEHAGLPFFAMPYVSGGTLADRLKGGPLSSQEACRMGEAIARGVHAAHQNGIVHRDLKPANVLLTAEGVPRVTDFGLAKHLGGSAFTRPGALLGTPAYMAPEQADGRAEEVGPSSDVYALGVILYECLTGRPPFEGPAHLVLFHALHTEPVAPRRRNRDVPRDLETVCLKCLAKDKPRRYPSAHELAEDLARFARREPIRARRAGLAERWLLWARRRPALAAVALLVILLLGVGGVAGGMSWLWVRAEQARQEARASRDVEAQARRRAEEQTRKAEELKARVDRLLYLNRLSLAEREWELGNTARAHEILGDCRWDLRGFEHAYVNIRFDLAERPPLRGHEGPVEGVCFSPDGGRLATAGRDGTVKVWDVRTGKAVLTLAGHTGAVYEVHFSPDGTRLASAGEDRTVRVWDGQRGQEILALKGHSHIITGVRFSPDGARLATSSYDQTVKVWDVRTGQEVLTAERASAAVESVSYSPDGRRLAGGCADGTVQVWDASAGTRLHTLKGHSHSVWRVRFSPDGTRLASASHDTTVKVWDVSSGAGVFSFDGHRGFVRAVCFSPDGRRIASASGDRTVRIWDARTGREVFPLTAHADSVLGVAFSPDGRHVATAGGDGAARVWDASHVEEGFTLKGHAESVACVAFSPDGTRLASASWDRTVKVWDLVTGTEAFALPGHTGSVRSVCFSPAGARLASAGGDQAVRVWDARTGKGVHVLPGHTGAVYDVCFHPDGGQIASAGGDRKVRLWDADKGAELFAFSTAPDLLDGVAFSADGRRIVGLTSPADEATPGEVRVWDARTGKLLAREADPAPRRDKRQAASPAGDLLARAEGNKILLRPLLPRDARPEGLSEEVRGVLSLHLLQLRHAERAGEWFPAVAHLSQLLRHAPQSASLRKRRARAVGAYLEAHPDDAEALLARARLCLDVGDRAGYRAACARLRERHGKDATLSRRLAWACALAPGALDDLAPLIEAARADAAKGPGASRTLGALLLRAGRAREALPHLRRAREGWGGTETPVEELLLALAYHRLGQHDEARRWLRWADEWFSRPDRQRLGAGVALLGLAGRSPLTSLVAVARLPPPGPEVRPMLLGWERWLECEVLHREARQDLEEGQW